PERGAGALCPRVARRTGPASGRSVRPGPERRTALSRAGAGAGVAVAVAGARLAPPDIASTGAAATGTAERDVSTGRARSSRATRASARRRSNRETTGVGPAAGAAPGAELSAGVRPGVARRSSALRGGWVPTPSAFPGGPPEGRAPGGLAGGAPDRRERRSEEHTSELQS